jgi:hypothetical protein
MKIANKKALTVYVALALSPAAVLAGTDVTTTDSFLPPALLQMTQTVTTATTAAVTTPLSQVIGDAINGLKTMLISAQQTTAANALTAQQARDVNNYATQQAAALQPAADACASAATAAYAPSVTQNYQYHKSMAGYRGALRAGNSPDGADQKKQVQSNHFNFYCDPNTDPAQCVGAKAPQDNGSTKKELMISADQRAGTLFGGAGAPGHVTNLTYTQQQQQAAQDYISNAVDGTDAPRKLSAAEYNTPQGQQYEGLRIAYESRLSLSRDAMEYVLASRTPIPGSHQTVNDMVTADGGASASYINARLNDPVSGILMYSPSGDVSQMQLLDLEVGRRVDNPDWYKIMNTNSDTNALLRELVFMSALQLKMQYMRLREGEYTASIAAVNAAEAAKTNMKERLNSAETSVIQGLASQR